MKVDFRFAAEILPDRFEETGLGVQSCHFVFVFIAQQFEITAGDGHAHLVSITHCRFGLSNLLDKTRVSISQFCILIVGQKICSPRYDRVERFVANRFIVGEQSFNSFRKLG